jgi:hypothetical protein
MTTLSAVAAGTSMTAMTAMAAVAAVAAMTMKQLTMLKWALVICGLCLSVKVHCIPSLPDVLPSAVSMLAPIQHFKKFMGIEKSASEDAHPFNHYVRTRADRIKESVFEKLLKEPNIRSFHVSSGLSLPASTSTSQDMAEASGVQFSASSTVSVQFVNLAIYGTTNCKDDPLTIFTYGTGICFAVASGEGPFNLSTVFVM